MSETVEIKGKKRIDWRVAIFTVVNHLLVFTLVPYYIYTRGIPSLGIIIMTVILFYVGILATTTLYHRYYSHKAYKLKSKVVEFLLLMLTTIGVEGSALRWAHDHRKHHHYVDTEKDPYCVKDGFWHAHMLWYFRYTPAEYEKYTPDLLQNKLVMFFDKYYAISIAAVNLGVLVFFGWLFNDYLASFVFLCAVRVFLVHHLTGFINSWAHWWGDRPYSIEHTAVNSYILCFFTGGEGYHNYHHTFGSDYRNGIKWYHFDPTKWIIWSMAKLGIAGDLVRMSDDVIHEALVRTDRAKVLEALGHDDENNDDNVSTGLDSNASKRNVLIDKINVSYDTILALHKEIRVLKKERKSIAAAMTQLHDAHQAWTKLIRRAHAHAAKLSTVSTVRA